MKDTNTNMLPAPELEAEETFLVYDHIVVICFLHFPGFQCHYTIDHSVVMGSCIGLTHAAFVLRQESLWFHWSDPILSVVKCYIALCIALSNHWRHQLHSRCLSETAVSQKLLVV